MDFLLTCILCVLLFSWFVLCSSDSCSSFLSLDVLFSSLPSSPPSPSPSTRSIRHSLGSTTTGPSEPTVTGRQPLLSSWAQHSGNLKSQASTWLQLTQITANRRAHGKSNHFDPRRRWFSSSNFTKSGIWTFRNFLGVQASMIFSNMCVKELCALEILGHLEWISPCVKRPKVRCQIAFQDT